jgi:hypothetical protein
MYFQSFNKIDYPFYNGQTGFDHVSVIDITESIQPTAQLVQGVGTYFPYVVKDGERPDTVSNNYYGSPHYDWLIRLVNQIVDDKYDWPMSNQELLTYCTDKYGSLNLYSTHHYTDPTGQYIVDSTYPGAIAVTNYQYESTNNDNKRNIFLVLPEYLPLAKQALQLLSTS